MALDVMDSIRGHEFWRDGLRTMAQAVCTALHYAGEPITKETILKFIDSMPRNPSKLVTEEWQRGYCSLCLEKAYAKLDEADKRQFIDYFARYFPERYWVCQEMLIDSFIGIFDGIPWEEFQCPTKG
jgi:hypothetical protein